VDVNCVLGAKDNIAAINACVDKAKLIPCDQLTQAPQGAAGTIERGPYTRCEGLYPWFIYKNTGSGNFASPVIKYQPVPLESDRGDSSLGPARGWTSQQHAILDFDGDGILDAIVKPATGNFWWVWFGDGTGGFEPTRHMFTAKYTSQISATGVVPLASVGATEGLFDLNADGLLDHWTWNAAQNYTDLWFNSGTGHISLNAMVTPSGVKPGDDAMHEFGPDDVTYIAAHPPANPSPTWVYWAGNTKQQNRVYDVDQDGRLDVVTPSPIEGPAGVFFNLGTTFNSTSTALSSNMQGLQRLTSVVGTKDIPDGTWNLLSDHIDLDGDGIAEVVDFSNGSYVRARQLNALPPRLLTKVHNGLGAHTTITYASMHDKTTVSQDPDSVWTDHWNRTHPNASPATQWVVKSMTSTDDYANTSSTTSYFYKNPRHGADDEGKYAFRGFGEVTTTTPSGATNVERYGFDVDWAGRLTETLVKPAPSEMTTADEVRSISRTTWEERTLYSGALRTQHATVTETFTCWNGQNEAACKADGGAAAYTRKSTDLAALTSPGASEPSIWVGMNTHLQAGLDPADGSRHTYSAFTYYADPGFYRLRPLMTDKLVRNGDSFTVFERTKTTWDSQYRVKMSEEVFFDENRSAVTHYDYDFTTGNVTKRWKPKQYATDQATTYTYDTRQMFITSEVNELGHRVDTTYDYGTGTKILTEGPNQRTCVTGTGCPLDASHPLKQQSKVVIDAAGRTLERWETVSDDGTLYTLAQTSSATYDNAPIGGKPRKITRRSHLDATSSVWTKEETEVDGLGRPLTKTVDPQGSAPASHVTVFTYRNDGTVASVQVPDPAQNNAARVTYSYFFDSLGRPTMMRRPDGSNPLTNQSGVNIQYNGTTVTTTTVAPPGTGEGQIHTTVATSDAFGRVTRTEELDPSMSAHPTIYTYGPDDNVQTITAPDGVITSMKHDFAGHRTEIARHGRTWKYGYDDNGNLESIVVPGSPNPPITDASYTSTIIYDALDRPIEKLNGPRAMSSTDQSLFANRRETFEYDIGGNMTGRLRYWRSFAPNQSTAAIVHSTRFDAQGNLITAIETLRIAGFPQLQRQIEARYQLLGGVSEMRFQDQIGGTNKTSATIAYDPRGLPASMVLKRTGQPDQTLAVQTRNVAGLVTKRRTDTTGAMTFVESNWVYDPLARLAIQTIQKGPGPVTVAKEVVRYFGDDSPQTVSGGIGTQNTQLVFTYDPRQQLKTVTSSVAGYFSATYNYGLGGRFKRATEAQTISPLPAGTNVKPRDVNYIYGDADPERLTALRNASNGSTYAGYIYDAVGNLTRRCNGGTGVSSCTGESMDYVYDGRDQLRRATKKVNGVVQGSEEYWYGGTGDRIAVVKRDASGTKTELVWFLGDVEAHYDGAGTPTHTYSHLSLGTPVARVDRTSNTATTLEFQFHGLGNNTLAAVAENGTVNASFRYAPFGEVIEAGGGTAGMTTHKRRFNDKYEDDLTTLAYYGARYYDKTSMTWTQGDPLYRVVPDLAKGSPRRANLYQFSLNNPLSYMDPDGHDSHWTRGSQGQLDSAMKREQKGQVYGGGWLEDYGVCLGDEKTPELNCGAVSSAQCEAVPQGETQETFAEAMARTYPGGKLESGQSSTAKMDETAVTASDTWFPDIARSCEKGDETVGEPPYERDDAGDSTGHNTWVSTAPPKPADTGTWRDGHGPLDIVKFGVGKVVGTYAPPVKYLAIAVAVIKGGYKLGKMFLDDPWGTKYEAGHNVWVPGYVKLPERARTYFDSHTFTLDNVPPVFQNTGTSTR
jgi:RHS repeat-associated protein